MWQDTAPRLGVPFVMRDVTLWAFTVPFFEEHPDEAKEFEDAMASMTQPLDAYLAQLSSIQTHDASARLDLIAVPTLVLAGEQDILIPVRLSKRLHDGIAEAEWATVSRRPRLPVGTPDTLQPDHGRVLRPPPRLTPPPTTGDDMDTERPTPQQPQERGDALARSFLNGHLTRRQFLGRAAALGVGAAAAGGLLGSVLAACGGIRRRPPPPPRPRPSWAASSRPPSPVSPTASTRRSHRSTPAPRSTRTSSEAH